LGQPGEAAGQLAVLRATLLALQSIQVPGQIVHMPFAWTDDGETFSGEKLEEPPIVKHILRHPWQLPRLLKREVPD
jgi:hypothetical protein